MHPNRAALVLPAAALLAATSAGETIVLTRDVPDLDRWNYPFNSNPGAREAASTFGAVGIDFFDDLEAQFLVGFDTAEASPDGAGVVPAGLAPSRYRVLEARLILTNVNDGVFVFDPTFDARETYLLPDDPDFVADGDAGRPAMLFGTGYRNGFGFEEGETVYGEFSPFTNIGGGPASNIRNAFATDFNGGSARDVSTYVRDDPDEPVVPFAVAQFTDAVGDPLQPGDPVPADAVAVFDIDLQDPDALAYLRYSLSVGSVRLSATALHEASEQGEVAFPNYFTKEDPFAVPFALAPRLEMTVEVLPGADLDGDGVVGTTDLGVLLAAWGACPAPPASCAADLNGDGAVGTTDLGVLLAAWGSGG